MSIATFVRDAGERIAANARAAFQMQPGKKESAPSPQEEDSPVARRNADDAAAEAIVQYIRSLNLAIDDLVVDFDATSATVRVSGTAADQATKEKVVLCCGNVQGVERVEENIAVRQSAAPAQYHTVVKGDTLSAIAKQYYGDANKYQAIFEANRPMLKDPDKIYPGQSLRIPQLETRH
jgi:nucleoid-associated protein YgaU